MIILTDDRGYAENLFSASGTWMPYSTKAVDPNLNLLKKRLFPTGSVFMKKSDFPGRWTHAVMVQHAPSSQFDHLVDMNQQDKKLPDGTLCLAGSGQNFHGQKQRLWAALEGNIHLAVCLSPHQAIKKFHSGFPLMVAISLIDALDAFESLRGRAKIKWVNDILIEGAKVAGFLVHTQSIENTVLTAVLGIGLNVKSTPIIQRDSFVPAVASLKDFIREESGFNQKKVLSHLLFYLDHNYGRLLDGQHDELLKSYRDRSLVIGRNVRVLSDTPLERSREIASGVVVEVGENLELLLKGHAPVTAGRLILL